jgi:hypothetical protein
MLLVPSKLNTFRRIAIDRSGKIHGGGSTAK